LQMSETLILIRYLRMYFSCNWEFGSTLTKLKEFRGGGGLKSPKPPLGTPLVQSYVSIQYVYSSPIKIPSPQSIPVFFRLCINLLYIINDNTSPHKICILSRAVPCIDSLQNGMVPVYHYRAYFVQTPFRKPEPVVMQF
jgi:hypothetical protein